MECLSHSVMRGKLDTQSRLKSWERNCRRSRSCSRTQRNTSSKLPQLANRVTFEEISSSAEKKLPEEPGYLAEELPPATPSLEPDLGSPLELKPCLAEFLGSLEPRQEGPKGDVGTPVGPPVTKTKDMIEWRSHQVSTQTCWKELLGVPGPRIMRCWPGRPRHLLKPPMHG